MLLECLFSSDIIHGFTLQEVMELDTEIMSFANVTVKGLFGEDHEYDAYESKGEEYEYDGEEYEYDAYESKERLSTPPGERSTRDWPFANWHWDTLLDPLPIGDLPPTVLLGIARHLDNDGRRAMSQTCSQFWNLLVDDGTIERRKKTAVNFVYVDGPEITLLKPREQFRDISSFKQYMDKVSIYRMSEKVWISWKNAAHSPFTVRELIHAMEGYSSVFGVRSVFTSGLNLSGVTNMLRETDVKGLIFTERKTHPRMQVLKRTCLLRGGFVYRENQATWAFRIFLDAGTDRLMVEEDDIPEASLRGLYEGVNW